MRATEEEWGRGGGEGEQEKTVAGTKGVLLRQGVTSSTRHASHPRLAMHGVWQVHGFP